MIVRPYGDAAVLFEPDEPAQVLALRAGLAGVPGLVELVPAACTLLVRFDPRVTDAAHVGDAAWAATLDGAPPPTAAEVELLVHYDGADLDSVAAEIGWSVPALIARHAAGLYRVAFCGFAPGFAYLAGLEPALHVGRLASPRTSVPAGSVGIAGEFTGVYPSASPGGWRLLGHTDAPLWDLARVPPALLTAGTAVRFRPQ